MKNLIIGAILLILAISTAIGGMKWYGDRPILGSVHLETPIPHPGDVVRLGSLTGLQGQTGVEGDYLLLLGTAEGEAISHRSVVKFTGDVPLWDIPPINRVEMDGKTIHLSAAIWERVPIIVAFFVFWFGFFAWVGIAVGLEEIQ